MTRKIITTCIVETHIFLQELVIIVFVVSPRRLRVLGEFQVFPDSITIGKDCLEADHGLLSFIDELVEFLSISTSTLREKLQGQ